MTFQLIFFNYDISPNNTFRNTKFSIHIDNFHMEGTMSQIFDICFGFCFMKCRTVNQKKITKSSRCLS